MTATLPAGQRRAPARLGRDTRAFDYGRARDPRGRLVLPRERVAEALYGVVEIREEIPSSSPDD
ncbi:MAG: hypothetical protein ABW208_12990 [Pyrinomonadaceae bacterium]